MNKLIRNLVIGAVVTTMLATGAIVLKKKMESKNVDKSTFADPRIEKVIVYKDGSMEFLLDFPEEYGLEEDTYVEQREDEIDYIEIYNEDGTTERIDYNVDAAFNNSNVQVKRKVM